MGLTREAIYFSMEESKEAEPAAKRAFDRDGEHAFNEDRELGMAFRVSKPVALHQLGREIAAAQGWDDPAGLVMEGDVFWVLGTDVDPDKVIAAVEAHDGKVTAPVDGVVSRILGTEDVSDADIRQALRTVLRMLGFQS